MSGFKSMVLADNKNVFLNTDEFADNHSIIYDGVTYSDIPAVLTKIKETERPITVSDHMEGLFLASVRVHFALSDMDGVLPEQGHLILIDDGEALGETFYRRYKITTSDCEHGMVMLELEAIEE